MVKFRLFRLFCLFRILKKNKISKDVWYSKAGCPRSSPRRFAAIVGLLRRQPDRLANVGVLT
jgi:hypothetical protein